MATWKPYRISEAIRDINDGKFVLPVIQRRLVWEEEKMELLFDTLLKGDSFGGIIVIEEEKGTTPLFSFRHFTKDRQPISSSGEGDVLEKLQYFVIDGQQRLQSFYIGLAGTMNGKNLYFDLFSNYEVEFDFKFSKDAKSLPEKSKDLENRKTELCQWYSVKRLLEELKKTNDNDSTTDQIIEQYNIDDPMQKKLVRYNVSAFYRNIIVGETLGLSLVTINKNNDPISNRQKIVELFRRLNDGGTRLSGFDLVASILKGFDSRMETYIDSTLSEFKDINLDQDNLVKLFFLLQDNPNREMAEITAQDASFAVDKRDRITSCLKATRKFLQASSLYTYYQESGKSFIPLYFIVYHLFHKKILTNQIESFFDNFDTGNAEFPLIKKWIFLSLINGIFRSKGAGWIPYKTGVKKLLQVISSNKNNVFPYNAIVQMYKNYGLVFTDSIDENSMHSLDQSFIYYLMYDKAQTIRSQDIDHIHPKSLLEAKGYEWDEVYNLCNYQLIDSRTNRVEKNALPLNIWINTKVDDKDAYLKRHLIPNNESLWDDDNYEAFLCERSKKIIEKIHDNGI
ncbi:hypothetical protein FACS1894147_01640 [Spirochaetia bacterium]|nr:hypothetical protein FACS1894147_01640 [Spirochaetia bacterium]